MQNFITIRLPPFAPQICENAHQVTRLAFFGSSDSLHRQVGVREFKYRVIDDPLFTGHVTQPNFGPKTGQKGLNNGDARL